MKDNYITDVQTVAFSTSNDARRRPSFFVYDAGKAYHTSKQSSRPAFKTTPHICRVAPEVRIISTAQEQLSNNESNLYVTTATVSNKSSMMNTSLPALSTNTNGSKIGELLNPYYRSPMSKLGTPTTASLSVRRLKRVDTFDSNYFACVSALMKSHQRPSAAPSPPIRRNASMRSMNTQKTLALEDPLVSAVMEAHVGAKFEY
jgi:hypothetical protein